MGPGQGFKRILFFSPTVLLIPGDEDARKSSGVDEAVARAALRLTLGTLERSPHRDEPGKAAGGGGERPAAVLSKLKRTTKAAEDELEHTVLRLLFWLHWELEGKGRRCSARLIEEQSRLELAAAKDSTAAISAGIGAGLRRCSIKLTETSRRGRGGWGAAREGLGRPSFIARGEPAG